MESSTKKKIKSDISLTETELSELESRLSSRTLNDEDYAVILILLRTIRSLRLVIDNKKLSIKKFLQKLFGLKTEKNKTAKEKDPAAPRNRDEASSSGNPTPKLGKSGKGRGGRNGRNDFPGAKKIYCPHESLKEGDVCPECAKGKLLEVEPAVEYKWEGQSPLKLSITFLQRFLCSICKTSFTAQNPVKKTDDEKKVDDSHESDEFKTARCDSYASANTQVALLRYEYGVPNYRLAKIQGRFGLALPEGTQWRMISQVSASCGLIMKELIREAARGDLLMNDDTKMLVNDLINKPRAEPSPDQHLTKKSKTSTRTSTVISKNSDGRQITLYFTGEKLAGENLAAILELREDGLAAPLHMCDGSSHSLVNTTDVEQLFCFTHARRGFFIIYAAGKKDLEYVTDLFSKIYEADRKTADLTPEQRLQYLKKHAQAPVTEIDEWMTAQIVEKKVEPNSALGKHIKYCQKRWPELTKFLTIPGAPLTNDETERKIKTAVVHRKNSLFYKTEKGALTGDRIMSVIQTCYDNGIDAAEYLTALQTNRSKVIENPAAWLPWNYSPQK